MTQDSVIVRDAARELAEAASVREHMGVLECELGICPKCRWERLARRLESVADTMETIELAR